MTEKEFNLMVSISNLEIDIRHKEKELNMLKEKQLKLKNELSKLQDAGKAYINDVVDKIENGFE